MHTHFVLLFVIFRSQGGVSRSTTNNATEFGSFCWRQMEYFLSTRRERKGKQLLLVYHRLSRVYRLKVAASSSIVSLLVFLVKSSSVGKCVRIISWRLYVYSAQSALSLSLTDYSSRWRVLIKPGAILAWPLFPLSSRLLSLSSVRAKEQKRIERLERVYSI